MKFGVLGDAKIARQKLRPAILNAGHPITMIGRRDPSLGLDPQWGDVAVGSYQDVFDSPNVDVIYNALPNHLHVDMTIKALEACKPVLCEKPIALSEKDLDRLEETIAKTGLYVSDGYMVRFHPQWKWLQSLDLGDRKIIQAIFSYPPQPDGNIRNYSKYGGGPLWDIGCYCVLAGLMLFDGSPMLVSSFKHMEKNLDVEMASGGIIDFGDGQILNFNVSSGAALCQSIKIVGSEGWASLDVPFNPPEVTKARFAVSSAVASSDRKEMMLSTGREVVFDPCDQYELMVHDFVNAVAVGRVASMDQSRQITRIIEKMLYV